MFFIEFAVQKKIKMKYVFCLFRFHVGFWNIKIFEVIMGLSFLTVLTISNDIF